MELIMLGTGNAMVTRCYNTCFVLRSGEQHLLVDGGGGNTLLRRLQEAHIDWRDLRTIFVTHKHIDHILGIAWMMRLICQNMAQGTWPPSTPTVRSLTCCAPWPGDCSRKTIFAFWTRACTWWRWRMGKAGSL